MVIWISEGVLTAEAWEPIERSDVAYVSAATIWEIEVKRAAGRLHAPLNVIEMVETSGFERLCITFGHAQQAARLPLRHRDPFDRMLVAQAQMEGLTLVTADGALAAYDVPVVSARRAA